MLFKRRKRKIRHRESAYLVQYIQEMKQHLDAQKKYIEQSVDPPEEVVVEMKITEAKYLFLLKEARAYPIHYPNG